MGEWLNVRGLHRGLGGTLRGGGTLGGGGGGGTLPLTNRSKTAQILLEKLFKNHRKK